MLLSIIVVQSHLRIHFCWNLMLYMVSLIGPGRSVKHVSRYMFKVISEEGKTTLNVDNTIT